MSATFTAPPSPPVPYGQPFYLLVCEDDSARGNGKPIAWETRLPEGGTLEEVEKLRLGLGSKYGQTWIARCEIVGTEGPNPEELIPFAAVPLDLLREIVEALELAGDHGELLAEHIEPGNDSRLAARMAEDVQGGLLGDADNARTLANRLSAYIPQPAEEDA